MLLLIHDNVGSHAGLELAVPTPTNRLGRMESNNHHYRFSIIDSLLKLEVFCLWRSAGEPSFAGYSVGPAAGYTAASLRQQHPGRSRSTSRAPLPEVKHVALAKGTVVYTNLMLLEVGEDRRGVFWPRFQFMVDGKWAPGAVHAGLILKKGKSPGWLTGAQRFKQLSTRCQETLRPWIARQ